MEYSKILLAFFLAIIIIFAVNRKVASGSQSETIGGQFYSTRGTVDWNESKSCWGK